MADSSADRSALQPPRSGWNIRLPAIDSPPGSPAAAQFAIVIQSSDHEATEQAVARSVAELGERSALVRNFNFQEALRLEEQWRLASGSGVEQPGQSAMAYGRADMKALAEHVRQKLGAEQGPAIGRQPAQPAEPVKISGVIVGAVDLAPALEQQLDFSSRGAAYTIAAPARRVAQLVERLAILEGQSTTLRMLDSDQIISAAEPGQPLALWLTEGPRVRQAIERLAEDPAAIALVPIIVLDPEQP